MRRRQAAKRELLPDPKFGSLLLMQFINRIMGHGKKSLAEKIMYRSLEQAGQKLQDQKLDIEGKEQEQERSLQILHYALHKVRPVVEVKSRRVGGATYQVPIEVRSDRATSLAMRWLLDAAKKRGEKTMAQRLAGEMVDACHDRGTAIKKREDTHRMAQANKAFAHYRW